MSEPRFVLGIDWATGEHAVCLIDVSSNLRHRRQAPHSFEGTTSLLAWLRQFSNDLSLVWAAIERPDHPLVDALIEAGLPCFAINPKQADRFRDRFSPAGAKDDRRDALVLASALRTDPHAFRAVPRLDPATLALREASRRYDTLSTDLGIYANRLWELLQRFAPGLLTLSSGARDPFFWDLLEVAADPHRARTLRLARVETILKTHRIRRVTASQALALLRAPRLPLAPGALEAHLASLASLIPQLRLTQQLLLAARTSIRALLKQAGPDARIIDSLIGADVIVTATFLAEAHAALAARDLQALRARAGAAPVTLASGKSRSVRMRHACNPRLRDACFALARTAARDDPWAAALYAAMRARGLSPARALRGVADRLLTRLVACLRANALYQPLRSALTDQTALNT